MILIVDDDPVQTRATGGVLTALGQPWQAVSNSAAALKWLDDPTGAPAAIFLHLAHRAERGGEPLSALIAAAPHLPLVAVVEPDAATAAIAAMRHGARDVLVKPLTPSAMKAALARAAPPAPAPAPPQTRPDVGKTTGFDALVAHSPKTRHAIALARRAAHASIPILIQGESGVGKEVFAHAIHAASPRADGPFIAVNCGAIPQDLVESLLFGHEKGAFTGAVARSSGKFQEAHGGVLFLDEVGELPLPAQVKLLRALQDGVIEPLGAARSIASDFRLISATNRDLAEDVAAGRFREDLYYRLSAFPLTLPPLRHRQEDILPLATVFTERFAALEQRSIRGVGDIAATLILRAGWPGNVRQLENAIHRAVILADGPMLEVEDFPDLAFPAPRAKTGEPDLRDSALLDRGGHIRPLADIEADAVRAALNRYDGAVSEAARRLGIGRSTLYRKAAALGLAIK